MQCEIDPKSDHTLIRLTGDIDLASSPRARRALLEGLERGLPLLLEMSGVTYIDDTGLAGLAEGFHLARAQEVDFALIGVDGVALEAMELARLDRVFLRYDTIAEYLEDRGVQRDGDGR